MYLLNYSINKNLDNNICNDKIIYMPLIKLINLFIQYTLNFKNNYINNQLFVNENILFFGILLIIINKIINCLL